MSKPSPKNHSYFRALGRYELGPKQQKVMQDFKELNVDGYNKNYRMQHYQAKNLDIDSASVLLLEIFEASYRASPKYNLKFNEDLYNEKVINLQSIIKESKSKLAVFRIFMKEIERWMFLTSPSQVVLDNDDSSNDDENPFKKINFQDGIEQFELQQFKKAIIYYFRARYNMKIKTDINQSEKSLELRGDELPDLTEELLAKALSDALSIVHFEHSALGEISRQLLPLKVMVHLFPGNKMLQKELELREYLYQFINPKQILKRSYGSDGLVDEALKFYNKIEDIILKFVCCSEVEFDTEEDKKLAKQRLLLSIYMAIRTFKRMKEHDGVSEILNSDFFNYLTGTLDCVLDTFNDLEDETLIYKCILGVHFVETFKLKNITEENRNLFYANLKELMKNNKDEYTYVKNFFVDKFDKSTLKMDDQEAVYFNEIRVKIALLRGAYDDYNDLVSKKDNIYEITDVLLKINDMSANFLDIYGNLVGLEEFLYNKFFNVVSKDTNNTDSIKEIYNRILAIYHFLEIIESLINTKGLIAQEQYKKMRFTLEKRLYMVNYCGEIIFHGQHPTERLKYFTSFFGDNNVSASSSTDDITDADNNTQTKPEEQISDKSLNTGLFFEARFQTTMAHMFFVNNKLELSDQGRIIKLGNTSELCEEMSDSLDEGLSMYKEDSQSINEIKERRQKQALYWVSSLERLVLFLKELFSKKHREDHNAYQQCYLKKS